MNHPDEPEDPLLASARHILTSSSNTFEVKDWRTIMGKNAAAVAKSKEVKDAAKKVEAKGVQPYKHEQGANSALGSFAASQLAGGSGVDAPGSSVVHSGVDSSTTQENPVSDTKTPAVKTKQDADAEKAKAKIAEKEAKQAAKAKKDADALALKEARKKEREEAAAKRKAEREANGPSKIMQALGERTKAGAYVKGLNGQLRSTDEVALLVEAVPAKKTVAFLLNVFQIPGEKNPYAALNYGQQSMNLRNKLRGAIRRASPLAAVHKEFKLVELLTEEQGKVVVTLDYAKSIRDDGGFATAEAEATAAAEARKKAAAEKEAAKAAPKAPATPAAQAPSAQAAA